jgi:hypothetical protein
LSKERTEQRETLEEAVETRAGDALLLPVALAAFWTLAYQLVLVARSPAWTLPWFFFAIGALGFFFLSRLWTNTNANPLSGYRFHRSQLLLLGLAIACATVVLFIRRANQDDIVYFHRALAQLSALGKPILTRQTSVDMDAAAFSPVHLATSHEMLMAFLGHYLGIDPLYVYQVVGHAFAAFSIPFVFYWSARRLGLDRWPAAVGALLAVAFLLVDSAGAAAFGNTAFGRMWQGKAIVWILFPPVALSLSYRFLREGNRSDLAWLVLLAIAGVGLTNTALYLIPATIGCSGLSFLGVELLECPRGDVFWKQFYRCLLLAIPLAYPVAILMLLNLNVISKPTDIHGFGPQYIPWQQGLDYVVGRPAEHVRNIVIMIAVPLLVVRGKSGFFLFLYICAVWLLCLNPLLARWWMRHITALCYFRLNYLLPLPLLCAMLPSAAHSWRKTGSGAFKRRMLTDLALLGIIAIFMHSYRVLSIMPRSAVRAWKSPLEYQLLKENMDFGRAAGRYIAHCKLLAPDWTASCELPLLFPEMKVVAPRLVTHYFANAGSRPEGALRQMAQAFVEGEKTVSPQRAAGVTAAFRTVIKSGRANAVATPEAESARVLVALQSIDPRWHRVLDAGGLVLMLPDEVEPESRK